MLFSSHERILFYLISLPNDHSDQEKVEKIEKEFSSFGGLNTYCHVLGLEPGD